MLWSLSFRIVLISILINDYLQIALRLIKDYLSGFWSFGTCRRHAFLFFCSSVGAEASFLSFFGFRHLPKTCFPDFHSVGRCRSSVFWIFSFSAPAEELFFRFSLRRWVPKRCFLLEMHEWADICNIKRYIHVMNKLYFMCTWGYLDSKIRYI